MIFLKPHEWFELKAMAGTIFRHMQTRPEEKIPDYLHNGVLKMLKLPPDTVADYTAYASEQFKLITATLTLLYCDSKEIDKRQVFIYESPSKAVVWHVRK